MQTIDYKFTIELQWCGEGENEAEALESAIETLENDIIEHPSKYVLSDMIRFAKTEIV